jgi:hypothetical protein
MKHVMPRTNFLLCFLLIFSCSFLEKLQATHSGNRYFPFLERPESYVIKERSHIAPSFFFTTASTAFRRGGGTGGIPGLWGRYDLNDVIASLQTVNPNGINPVPDPIKEVTGASDLAGKSMVFKVDGKVKSCGLLLNYEQDLGFYGFSLGTSIPVMHVSTTSRFFFNRKDSDAFFQATPSALQDQEDLLIDKIRRVTHQEIGLQGNEWEAGGFGDLDAHVRWSYSVDHRLMMRSIDFNIQLGVVAPTSRLSNIYYPSSVSFMNNGHWGIYTDCVTEFELKQDIKVGLMIGGLYQLNNTRSLRIPVGQEPAIFSSLIGRIEIDPASTFKFSPWLQFDNLTDGLHVQGRYTYLRHNQDTWHDKRQDKTIQSYLQKDAAIINDKRDATKWRMHYMTLQIMYDAKDGLQNWFMDPVFYVAYDSPIGGNGMSKTHQATFGVELHF